MLATRISFRIASLSSLFAVFAVFAVSACSSGDPGAQTDVDPDTAQPCDDRLPTCKPGDDFAHDDDPCEADGGDCYAVSTCKYTLYCKPAK